MPTYDYECRKCGYHFEMFQSMKDAPITVCPECGQEVRRLIGGGLGVIFKGSGFYTTDYKRSSSNISGNSGNKENKDNNKGKTGNTSTEKTEKTEIKTEAKKESINV